MSISIRAAVKNIASESYNKKNLFYFIVLIFISGICGTFFPSENIQEINSTGIFALTVYLLLCFLSGGIYISSANNAIFNKQGIIPNLFTDIKQIIVNAISYFAGCFAIFFIMSLLIFIPFFILVMIQPLLGLLIIPLVFLFGLYFLGFYFNYIKSLNIADWFNIKNANNFLKKSGGKLIGIYVSKYIIINLAALVIALIFIIPIMIILGIQSVFSPIPGETLKITASSISSIIISFIFGICNIYTIDLTAQYLKEVDEQTQDAPIETTNEQIETTENENNEKGD